MHCIRFPRPLLKRTLARSVAPAYLLAALLCIGSVRASAQTPTSEPLRSDSYSDEARLVELLWERSPDVLEARATAGVSAAEVTRAQTYPNPQLDFTWDTIPVGRSNPRDLHDPLANVPNYTTGLSQLIEIAKRGPRQAATVAEAERARSQAVATLADRFFELLASIGGIATNELRLAVLNELVDASGQLLDLDRARSAKGELAALDLDRAEVERLSLLVARDAATTDLEESRASCGILVARTCSEFASAADTRAFIEHMVQGSYEHSWSEAAEQRRPDIRAVDAMLRAATERKLLGERKAIPDLTARLGYTYDTFEVSGNQAQSLAVGVQVPLPVFDRGQADVSAAAAVLLRAQQTRQSLVEAGRTGLEAAARRLESLHTRLQTIDTALSKARGVRDAVQAAQQRGGVSMTDVLLGRRAYQQLLLDQIGLLGQAYDAALALRRAGGLFPQPPVATQMPAGSVD